MQDAFRSHIVILVLLPMVTDITSSPNVTSHAPTAASTPCRPTAGHAALGPGARSGQSVKDCRATKDQPRAVARLQNSALPGKHSTAMSPRTAPCGKMAGACSNGRDPDPWQLVFSWPSTIAQLRTIITS
jgi:hypothetical protein